MRPVQHAHSFVARHTCLIIGLVDALMHFPDPSFRTKHSFPRLLEHWLWWLRAEALPRSFRQLRETSIPKTAHSPGERPPSNPVLMREQRLVPRLDSGHPEAHPSSRAAHGISWDLYCDGTAAQPPPLPNLATLALYSLNLRSLPIKFLCVNFSKSVSKEN